MPWYFAPGAKGRGSGTITVVEFIDPRAGASAPTLLGQQSPSRPRGAAPTRRPRPIVTSLLHRYEGRGSRELLTLLFPGRRAGSSSAKNGSDACTACRAGCTRCDGSETSFCCHGYHGWHGLVRRRHGPAPGHGAQLSSGFTKAVSRSTERRSVGGARRRRHSRESRRHHDGAGLSPLSAGGVPAGRPPDRRTSTTRSLIFDEMITAFRMHRGGRTDGSTAVTPDLTCVGKIARQRHATQRANGGGKDVMEYVNKIFYGMTLPARLRRAWRLSRGCLPVLP